MISPWFICLKFIMPPECQELSDSTSTEIFRFSLLQKIRIESRISVYLSATRSLDTFQKQAILLSVRDSHPPTNVPLLSLRMT